MHLTIITKTHIVVLGIAAKGIFLNHVLWPDENGRFDAVQEFSPFMLIGAMQLPLEGGINEEIKHGIIDAFADLKEGERFILSRSLILDPFSPEARFHQHVAALLNSNRQMSIADAVKQANMKVRETQKG